MRKEKQVRGHVNVTYMWLSKRDLNLRDEKLNKFFKIGDKQENLCLFNVCVCGVGGLCMYVWWAYAMAHMWRSEDSFGILVLSVFPPLVSNSV